ncbi:RNA methyltransferase [Hyphococcus luteus]|uniref:rRNA methyltransferase n=1 Tax=Hyphococcus luteus TaxID=2058213 RepID=A0A2S7K6G7_9PROT|nr:RNA methyltransferase [Marinicaulis flavus]PQA88100.1 rRNA methyltransferase [Marinicaulis flavus]
MRGYFGIGSERISKAMNLGAVLRTAHAFDASFVFTVNAHHNAREVNLADTSKSGTHVPLYEWDSLEEMRLPKGCVLVGVELDETAVDLPSFRHPLNAAYFLGPEKGSLSPEAAALCTHLVKIPTRFCVNLSVAAALVMYDRTVSMGGYAPRPVSAGGPVMAPPPHAEWRKPRRR